MTCAYWRRLYNQDMLVPMHTYVSNCMYQLIFVSNLRHEKVGNVTAYSILCIVCKTCVQNIRPIVLDSWFRNMPAAAKWLQECIIRQGHAITDDVGGYSWRETMISQLLLFGRLWRVRFTPKGVSRRLKLLNDSASNSKQTEIWIKPMYVFNFKLFHLELFEFSLLTKIQTNKPFFSAGEDITHSIRSTLTQLVLYQINII